MSTKAREWPNGAKEARDRAAEEAVRALRTLEPMLNDLTRVEDMRRIAIAINSLQTIARLLEQQGAQTRP